MKKENIRRSISLPKELDDRIDKMTKKYSYSVKNDLYVELVELGLLKFEEDLELKNMMYQLLTRVNVLIENLESK